MTTIDHIKNILAAAKAHEEAAFKFRVAAFENCQVSIERSPRRIPAPIAHDLYEAARANHERICLGINELETLLKTFNA